LIEYLYIDFATRIVPKNYTMQQRIFIA